MNVVLSILKVVGVILLVAVVIVVLALLAVLYVPVRYEVEGDIQEISLAKAKVHWLLHLFRIKVSYEDDLIFVEIHIFWIRKTLSFELHKDVEEDEDEGIEAEDTSLDDENMQNTSQEVDGQDTDDGMITKIKGILNRIKDILPKLKKILTDERNKAAVVHLKDELFYLIQVLLPKQSKVDAVFSTGSPDTTGQAFGVLSCFPIIYQESWSLIPDFQAEEPYFKGNFWGKGKVYGYKIVGIILRIVFDKNCQRLYTIINKFIKYVKRK